MAEDVFLQKRIFDWSRALPTWQRALLRQLCGGPLEEAARERILSAVLDGSSTSLEPLELEHLPADATAHGTVELREIRQLRNVNRLAPDEVLRFGPGLNIVFGENGSGKSGYGRLCRRVCRAAEPGEVLRNVFDPGTAAGPQTAEFVLSVDGDDETFEVDLSGDAPRVLSAMTAFDASCAQTYLSKANTIEHTPRPLRLLRQLCEAQDDLTDTLVSRAAKHREGLPPFPSVAEGTTAAELLERASRGDVSCDEIRDFARLSGDEFAELEQLTKDEAAIASRQSEQQEKACRAKATVLDRLLSEIDAAWELLDDEQLAEIAQARHALRAATAAAHRAAEEAFANQRMPSTGGDAWQEMWNAALRFAESGGGQFPDSAEDAACPLCQQDLEPPAQTRIRRFGEFVAGDLRTRAETLEKQLSERLRRLPDVEYLSRIATASTADVPDDVRTAVDTAASVLANRKAIAVTGPDVVTQASIDLSPLRAYVVSTVSEAERHAALRDTERQARVRARLAELRARETLATSLTDILARVDGLKTASDWEKASRGLRTQAITRKIGEFSKLAITDRLREALEQEIQELDPIADHIELDNAASKGKPTVKFKLRGETRERVARVLSTGEQTALATAFFLAELRVTNERSAIILDDPVSSLDHQRREHVAARLVEEAQTRQVVIFTHDVVFVHYLRELTADAGREIGGQTLVRANRRVGVVDAELPWAVKSPRDRLAALRHALKYELSPMFKREDPRYVREVQQWALDLRKGYERLIESYVLGGTVERHARNIRVKNLHTVRWTPSLAQRIDDAMRAVSAFAHDEPLAQHTARPRPEKLAALLADYEAMCEELRPTKKSAADGGDESPSAEVVQVSA
jgi:hypothetical protein